MTSGIRKLVLAWRCDEGLIACKGAEGEGQLPDEVERDQVDVPLGIGRVNDLLMAMSECLIFRTRVRNRARPVLAEPYTLEIWNEQETVCGQPGL